MVTRGWTRRQFFTRAATAGAVAIGGPVLLSACGDGDNGESRGRGGNTLERAREQGLVRVGIANEPPYTEVTASGEVTGVEPDVLRAVLKKLGIDEIEGIVTPYDQMIPGLQANRWDVVAAGLFMKQSRCAEVLYSEPTIVSTESFAVLAGNPEEITTVASVKENSGVKVAALGGAFEEGVLQDADVPEDQIVPVQDGRSGIEAVKAGRADAFFLPTLSLNDLLEGDDEMEVTDPVEDAPVTGAGHAFRKNDTEFHEEYNAALAEMKESDEYADILAEWGFNASDVEGVTTEELCATEG
ncbi:ectoine/hydroxyectoine ABC transporter substrate-binding protein EhuB [Haloechinothrix sp. YIM 98757]|uniref:Ectoine/hydroxyectoine ABC transporter substrate-binding protein EhuB n=1 Tax=Haloechinothrix aidingensis TaxID=2752311 RepID=A0A838AEF5_9PSEU|nr:ectoine/hydroxyectoine ABC transporter substrate-binding protein EhuB [Haloechinothrix aidingensis]MBA0127662.1 ectoine/hydroxyectoine ABC transporter substrate-binding protein EhuB [Haloechinothrix aidingensis]